MPDLTDIAKGTNAAPAQPPAEEPKKAKKQSAEDMELEIKKLELEAKQLEVAERKANVQDLQERLAERELKRENKKSNSLTNGATLKQLNSQHEFNESHCTHRKGGNTVAGGGQDQQYAVLKHKFANGDLWVRCLRCSKTWKPPMRESFKNDADFATAQIEYNAAVAFETRNVTSGSTVFVWTGEGAQDFFRLKMANTNLR